MSAAAVMITAWLLALAVAAPARAGGDPDLTTQLFASGLTNPMFLTHAPGESDRVYIVERAGRIKIYTLNGTFVSEYLNIVTKVNTFFEGGLLGLAFHPEYDENGKFYVYYTETRISSTTLRSVLEEYTVDQNNPNLADLNSARTILKFDQPAGNHNGGWIGFGPNDGYLYIASGDGGGSATAGGARAQNITDWLGKILRIDIDGDDFPANPDRNYAIPPTNPFTSGARSAGRSTGSSDEVWAFGLRNPFRCSFDRETGDFWIGDVGAVTWEEINFQPAASPGGENYGWNCQEGEICVNNANCNCPADEITHHIHTYPRGTGGSVTGGVVYRGCAIPELQGTYFFADFVQNQIWSFRYNSTTDTISNFTVRTTELDPPGFSLNNIVAFGEDAYGEMYICDLFGNRIFKVVPRTAAPDCNGDGIPDSCDADCNNNGVPDGCDLPGDANGDGTVNVLDLLVVISQWGNDGSEGGDLNCDGAVNVQDLLEVISNWGSTQ